MPARLRRELKLRQMTTAQLSRVVKAGPNTVTQIEAGQRIPRLPMLERLADALRVSPGELAYGLPGIWEAADQPRCGGLAARVQQLRVEQGLSLREVGRRADTSASAVRQLEGGSQPTLDTLEALAKALQVSPAWLAYGLGPRELPRRGTKPAPAASPRHPDHQFHPNHPDHPPHHAQTQTRRPQAAQHLGPDDLAPRLDADLEEHRLGRSWMNPSR